MRRLVASFVFVGTVSLVLPVAAAAQATISGLVQDTTGAVLPGVTVEASSPALIERVRSAVTDASGRYTIVDLRPGMYAVTFSLPGFSSIKRDGIVLEGAFTAQVNAELRVGAVEETVTVSGQAPVVDVQSTHQQTVINRELLDVLPTSRTLLGRGSVLPGLTTNRTSAAQVIMSVHGSPSGDAYTYLDGMRSGHVLLGGGAVSGGPGSSQFVDSAQAEVTFDTGAQPAEMQVGGIRMNAIPREGGNLFSGSGFVDAGGSALQGNNQTAEQQATIRPANRIAYIYEWSPSLGGPIVKDKLWFFGSARFDDNKTYVGDSFFKDGRQTFNDPPAVRHAEALRLTAQVTPRNKIGVSLDKNQYVFNHVLLNLGMDAEAGSTLTFPIANLLHVKWTSTVTNRLLLEAGFASMRLGWRYKYLPEVGPNDLTYIELTTGRVSNASQTIQEVKEDRKEVQGSLSYVTGSHTFKTGVNALSGYHRQKSPFHGDIGSLNFFGGQPNSINVLNTPGEYQDNLNVDAGAYAQDRWTLHRVTLNIGGRYDHFNGGIDPQSAAAGQFVPARQFGAISNLPNWNDWALRFGAAYDLFGTGKTALKGNVSKYVSGMSLGLTSPFNPLSLKTERRSWQDLNHDNTVLNPDGTVQYGEIGPAQDVNFGLAAGTTRLDPNLPRDYNWQQSVTIEHELRPGVSIGGGYYRRQFYNLRWTDNLLVNPDRDYTPFTITAPADPRLPNGGGEVITVYNLNPAKLGLVDNVIKASTNNSQVYNGFEITGNARLPRGATVFGGLTTERLSSDMCQVANPNQRRFCATVPPFRTLLKLAGTTQLPYRFQLSAAFQSKPGLNNSGLSKGATYTVTSAIAGLPLTGGVPIAVQLIAPNTLFPDFQNVLDLRVQRLFTIGRVRLQPHADIFNALNANTVVQTNETYGPLYDRPQLILQARYLRLGMQIDF